MEAVGRNGKMRMKDEGKMAVRPAKDGLSQESPMGLSRDPFSEDSLRGSIDNSSAIDLQRGTRMTLIYDHDAVWTPIDKVTVLTEYGGASPTPLVESPIVVELPKSSPHILLKGAGVLLMQWSLQALGEKTRPSSRLGMLQWEGSGPPMYQVFSTTKGVGCDRRTVNVLCIKLSVEGILHGKRKWGKNDLASTNAIIHRTIALRGALEKLETW
ncbi:uncharacterized protein G2W53_000692 [Senna tora]|uniref:Uncharacterized protein n=1 Tax=Senna tora TaxID=362788 RepID=A0A834XGC5_9FABA|nr:uncharacterized protein G2W53_000692 [Senna tora]